MTTLVKPCPAVPLEDAAAPADAPQGRAHSYRGILKSSAVIGGSSMITVGVGMVRTKIMAVLLGPADYGMMGAYLLISDLARSVAQMGLTSSGVRQIADSVASGDTTRIARTLAVLRHTSLACALLGALALALVSEAVSNLTFGTGAHAGSVAWLSLAVFFSVIGGGQGALLQGMRQIGDMARLGIIGGVLGLVFGVPLVYFLGERGLVPTVIAVSASTALATWWYSRRIAITAPPLNLAEFAAEATQLLKLGVAFMASGLLMTGAAYAVRTMVLRKAGLEAAGIYYAAWTLGGLYIGFVLQALGADFYPRLVGLIRDHAACNRLVNEQVQVSLLLATPGVIATLSLAPVVMQLFYSAKFMAAVEVLRWICLGMAMRVLTWPIGTIVVAKNRQTLFMAVEVAWTVVNLALTWWCVDAFGVDGAGIAFFGSYVFHAVLIYPIVRRLSDFRWSTENLRTTALCFSAIAAVFHACRLLPPMPAAAVGALATIASSYCSIRMLVRLTSPQRLPRPIARLLQLGATSR